MIVLTCSSCGQRFEVSETAASGESRCPSCGQPSIAGPSPPTPPDAITLTHFPALWRLRHDTGEARVELEGSKVARIELWDYALPPGNSCELVEGTIWGFLHHSEAKGIQISHSRCRGRGDAVCEWTAKWA